MTAYQIIQRFVGKRFIGQNALSENGFAPPRSTYLTQHYTRDVCDRGNDRRSVRNPNRRHAAHLPRPKGLRDGGCALPQEQESAQHGRGQRLAKWRRYSGGSKARGERCPSSCARPDSAWASIRTGLTPPSVPASGRSGAFIRPAAVPTVCDVLVHECQRPDDAFRSRGDLGGGQGAISKELDAWKTWTNLKEHDDSS